MRISDSSSDVCSSDLADWGRRALGAFDEALRANGGAVVSTQRYDQRQFDQSKIIASLMGVSASEDRHRSLTTTLGEKSEFEPQRRADIDMIFLGARGQDARADSTVVVQPRRRPADLCDRAD